MKHLNEKAAVVAMAVMLVTIVALMLALSQAWRNERSLDAKLNQYKMEGK